MIPRTLRFEDKSKLFNRPFTLVWVDGTPAGWIVRDRRHGAFDFTLTRLGDADDDIVSCFKDRDHDGGQWYKRGLDNVPTLDVLKHRIRELVK